MEASPTTSVVGRQFCNPHTVDLTVTKNAASCFFKDVGGGFTTPMGCPSSPCEGRLQYTWEVFRGDSMNAKNLLFTARRSSLLPQLKLEIDIFLAGSTVQKNARDFRIKCSCLSRSCTLYIANSGTPIAQINRKFSGLSDWVFGGGKFSVAVFPHVDYVFVMALVVILDKIARDIRGGAMIMIELDF
uniref:Uncharacterized protein n=1 Tax=Leersia perrieri TaxID=77586 RepID=A0A0D9WWZ6_9ORYZ